MQTNYDIENRKKIYEEYEESLFRLIMYDVAQKEGEVLLKENKLLKEKEETIFPEELQKFKKLLNAELDKKNIEGRQKKWYKMINIAAAVILVLSIAFSVSMLTVEAFRVQVLNFVLKMEDKYTTIELDESADPNSDLNPIVDWANSYAPTYLPEGFQIAKESETDTFKSITIVNKEGLFIKYQQFIQSASINFDTENAASIENIQIGDNDATLIVKDSLTSIIWN